MSNTIRYIREEPVNTTTTTWEAPKPAGGLPLRPTLHIQTLASDDATIVRLHLHNGSGEGISIFDGTAKRRPGDRRNPDIGLHLALGRARTRRLRPRRRVTQETRCASAT